MATTLPGNAVDAVSPDDASLDEVASDDASLDEVRDDDPQREWDRFPVAPALGLVLLGVVWFLAMHWPRPPASDSADAGFLRDMIVHHNQAVLMGQIAWKGSTDPDVSILAIDIADSQQVQVGQMFGWLEQWDLSPNSDGPAMDWMGMPVEGLMPGMATPEEIERLRTLTGAELDVEFLRLMTVHHMAGADMASACVELCEEEEVVRLARGVVRVQQSEIDLMNGMLVARGQPAVVADDGMAGMDMGGMDMGADPVDLHPSSGETLGDVLVEAVRSIPIPLGLTALAWLVVDALRRRRGLSPGAPLAETTVLLGLTAALISATLHSALAPALRQIDSGYGSFHSTALIAQAAAVGLVLAMRTRGALLAGAVVPLAVVAGWAVVRLVAPSDETGRYDLAVTVAMAVEAVQAGSLFWAWRTAEDSVDESLGGTASAGAVGI